MSKKKKKQASEQVTETQSPELATTTEAQDLPLEQSEEVAPPADPTTNQIHLSDAARRFAKGFKEHWIPGILSHAQSKGLPEYATEEECKNILRQWGAAVD